jgi:hypothetical protein
LTVRTAKPAVFLDRDGVLNEAITRGGKPGALRDLGELVITCGARTSLEELKREGFLLIVVTNQPDIARGKANRADVDKINAKLAAILPLDAIEFANTKKKQPTTGIAGLDENRNYTLDWSDVDSVNNIPGFFKVTLGKGHRTHLAFGETKIAYGGSSGFGRETAWVSVADEMSEVGICRHWISIGAGG